MKTIAAESVPASVLQRSNSPIRVLLDTSTSNCILLVCHVQQYIDVNADSGFPLTRQNC